MYLNSMIKLFQKSNGEFDMADFSKLTTESYNPRTAEIDKMSALEIAKIINEEPGVIPAHTFRKDGNDFSFFLCYFIDVATRKMKGGGKWTKKNWIICRSTKTTGSSSNA